MTEKKDNKELIAVLDQDGNPTGEVLPLLKVHEQELWHEAIITLIRDIHGKILAQIPGDSKKLHAAGGHRKVVKEEKKKRRKKGVKIMSESREKSAQREVREELKLNIPLRNFRVIHTGAKIVSPLRYRKEENASGGMNEKPVELEHRRIATVVLAEVGRALTQDDIERAVSEGEVNNAVLIEENRLERMAKRPDAKERLSKSLRHAMEVHALLKEQEKEKATVKRDVRNKVRKALAA